MASKYSKSTVALLAQFPAFDDWIVNNLTPDQLIAVRESCLGEVSFGDGHPMDSQVLGVQLWRAYRPAVLFELKCRWPEKCFSQPLKGCDRLAHFHQSVCMAIGLFVAEQPELIDKIIELQRREIETATGFAKSSSNPMNATGNARRL